MALTTNDFDIKMMQEALKLAKETEALGEIPVGCVVVRDGAIIGRGFNTRESQQQATGHAEIMAINEACAKVGSWRLAEADLYVTLEPCLMCAGAIQQARIRTVYFAAYDPKSGMTGSVFNAFSLPSNHHVKAVGGLLESEAATMLRRFFQMRRHANKEDNANGKENP